MTTETPATRPCPESLADIGELFGMGVVVRLMEGFGGREINFPLVPGPDHPLVEALGLVDARRLCAHMGGMKLYVPHGRLRRSQLRDRIREMEEAGATRGEIAQTLGISDRHARRIGNRVEEPPRALPLFPDE